jgi:hypothetical protein
LWHLHGIVLLFYSFKITVTLGYVTTNAHFSSKHTSTKMNATFETDQQFIIAFSALAGAILLLFFWCLASAVVIRRKRVLRQVINGDGPADDNVRQAAAKKNAQVQESNARVSRPREDNSALSFDARDGWRSNPDLRYSARSNPGSGSFRG